MFHPASLIGDQPPPPFRRSRFRRQSQYRQLFAITADGDRYQWVWPDDEPGINAKSGWQLQISHWWGLWGPNRMDKWATDHQDQGNPVSAREEWAALLRALQQLGWSALDQCRSVWKVFCRLRARIDADVAAKAKTVATRARQQRWRDSQTERESKRAAKREKASADKKRAHRLRAPLERSLQARQTSGVDGPHPRPRSPPLGSNAQLHHPTGW